jgi:hypothetical protein
MILTLPSKASHPTFALGERLLLRDQSAPHRLAGFVELVPPAAWSERSLGLHMRGEEKGATSSISPGRTDKGQDMLWRYCRTTASGSSKSR